MVCGETCHLAANCPQMEFVDAFFVHKDSQQQMDLKFLEVLIVPHTVGGVPGLEI